MNEDIWKKLLRWVAIALAIALWMISIKFSIDGFDFNSVEQNSYQNFFALILGLAVTLLELIYNEEGMKHSRTMIFFGILAYVYGIYTNFMGIYIMQGQPDYFQLPQKLIFMVVVGLLFEVGPEYLLLWGLNLSGKNSRDLFSHIFGLPIVYNNSNGHQNNGQMRSPVDQRKIEQQRIIEKNKEKRGRGRPPKDDKMDDNILQLMRSWSDDED